MILRRRDGLLRRRLRWAAPSGLEIAPLASMLRLVPVLFIGIIAASTASIFIRLCDAPALIISAYRLIFASLVLAPFALHQRVWKEWRRSEIPWLVLSGVFLSLHFASWISSLQYTSVASSVVLVCTNPIFVGIGSWLILKERLGINLILGILLSVMGSAIIGYGDFSLSSKALLGDGLALLGALAVSGYFLVGRKMRKDKDLLSYVFPVYSTAGLVLIPLLLLSRTPLVGYTTTAYFFIILLALIPQLIGHTAFNWALRYIPASIVAIAILGEPIVSTSLAYVILGEGLTLWKVIGGIVTLIGIFISLLKKD